jgi:transcriptional regulator with XRE-family HTH domain
MMTIGRKLRDLRTIKKLTQSDIEKRTGVRRPYTSRVENDLTTPSVDTIPFDCITATAPRLTRFHNSRSQCSVSTLGFAG